MLFMGAFAFGALLWAIWMAHIVIKTRAERDRISRDPMYHEGSPAPASPQTPK